MEESSREKSQGGVLEFLAGDEVGSAEIKLSILGPWEFDGPAKGLLNLTVGHRHTLYSCDLSRREQKHQHCTR